MKRALAGLGAAAVVVAAGSSGILAARAPSSGPARPPQSVLYGHIKSLTRKGGRFEMRFDPAWWLAGVTAERAAREDTGSSDVPNDYYIVEEGHRLLTYVVSATARVSVVTLDAGRLVPTTRISVSELAQIVQGRNPRHRRLLEPKAGFWIRVGARYPNPVVSLQQQYQP